MEFDAIVVGSGPSGAQAAAELVGAGLQVGMLDVGFDEPALAASIPAGTFAALRRTDPDQRRYLLGEDGDVDAEVNDRIGAHFTPPRSFVKRGVAEFAPIASATFFPETSLALGGLGAGWGSGSQVFEAFELERAGLPVEEMRECYDIVARDIGVSGAREDDTAESSIPRIVQPPAEIDANARTILAAYERRRADLRAGGFVLGRAPLALLTRPLGEGTPHARGANPYYDMDFYTDAARSVYRPKYTVEALTDEPNFRYVDRALVERFEVDGEEVRVLFRDLRNGGTGRISTRRLVLAANPLNTARIALRSRGSRERQPLLCNPYHYIPTVNLAMLGRAVEERRHSLAQLVGSFTPAHRDGEHVFSAFFSYRSLMHFRLVREMPLPPAVGLLVSRVLMNALAIVGVHHPERATERKWVRLNAEDVLEAEYALDDRERAAIAEDLRGFGRVLRQLGCVPLSTIATPPGSSIHYAGTIPFARGAGDPTLTCAPDGRLEGMGSVYVADSSSWRYLPAKGPTLSMMANARRVAREVARSLR